MRQDILIPKVSREQLLLFNELVVIWRQESQWPRSERLRVEWHTRGKDIDAILETCPEILWRRTLSSRDERIQLTLVGVELCEDGEQEVRPFLALVRQLVSQFIADPLQETRVTTEDLANILGPERADDIPRLIEYYSSVWEGNRSSTESPEWFLKADLRDLCLERVSTALEFAALRNPRSRRVETLEAAHLGLLKHVYNAWHETSEWPIAKDFVLHQRDYGDVISLMNEIPQQYIREMHLGIAGHNRYRLTLAGIALVEPGAESETAMRILHTIRAHYIKTRAECRISANEIAELIDLPASEVRRIASLLGGERFAGISIRDEGQQWSVKGTSRILSWDGTESYEMYARRCEELEHAERETVLHFVGSHSREELESVFAQRNLETTIAGAASEHFTAGKFRSAVLDATVALADRIKHRSGLADCDGTSLVIRAFSPKNGLLRSPSPRGRFEASIQEGWMLLFKGAFQALRNPSAHSLHELNPLEALDRLSFLSLLYRQLETMTLADGTTRTLDEA